ncbi:hypothetical protein D3C84_1003470 [compost metagenome]
MIQTVDNNDDLGTAFYDLLQAFFQNISSCREGLPSRCGLLVAQPVLDVAHKICKQDVGADPLLRQAVSRGKKTIMLRYDNTTISQKVGELRQLPRLT